MPWFPSFERVNIALFRVYSPPFAFLSSFPIPRSPQMRAVLRRKVVAAAFAVGVMFVLMPALSAVVTTVTINSISFDDGSGPVPYATAVFPSSYYNAVHIDLNLSAGAPFNVRFGPDFGNGGYMLIDGVQ